MGGTQAFPDLGSHCTHESCHQLDFLPFHCDSCNKVFCLEHRSYRAHNCPKADMKDTTVVLCPVCAVAVRKVFGEDPDITIENHIRMNCDPRNYDRVMNKPKCPVKRCREVLTTTNTYVCKSCKAKVCLKHRFPADHACAETRATVTNLAQDFMKILGCRNGTECGASSSNMSSKLGSASKHEGVLIQFKDAPISSYCSKRTSLIRVNNHLFPVWTCTLLPIQHHYFSLERDLIPSRGI